MPYDSGTLCRNPVSDRAPLAMSAAAFHNAYLAAVASYGQVGIDTPYSAWPVASSYSYTDSQGRRGRVRVPSTARMPAARFWPRGRYPACLTLAEPVRSTAVEVCARWDAYEQSAAEMRAVIAAQIVADKAARCASEQRPAGT